MLSIFESLLTVLFYLWSFWSASFDSILELFIRRFSRGWFSILFNHLSFQRPIAVFAGFAEDFIYTRIPGKNRWTKPFRILDIRTTCPTSPHNSQHVCLHTKLVLLTS